MTVSEKLPQPQDIELTQIGGTAGGFGYCEVEITAGRLVEFFKARGNWSSFTLMELAEFYRAQKWDPNTMLVGLAGTWPHTAIWGLEVVESGAWLIFDTSGACCVTEEFIIRCSGRWKPKSTGTTLAELSREDIEKRLRQAIAAIDTQVRVNASALETRKEQAKRFSDGQHADLFVQVGEDRLAAAQTARAHVLEQFPSLKD